MRFFKYLILIFVSLFPVFSYAAIIYACDASAECKNQGGPGAYIYRNGDADGAPLFGCVGGNAPPNLFIVNKCPEPPKEECPSATTIGLKVSINAQKYQCVNQCQYALTKCVDIDFEPGMTCDAISTGIDCGGTPPVKPKDPADNTQTPDAPTDTPAAPGQNTSNTNTNSATSTGTSTSTSTTTTNTANNTSTTTTTTTNNNTTTIDLSSLESTIESIGKILGGKLDAIKEALGGDSGSENGTPDGTDLTETNKKLDDIKNNGDKLNNWLQGKNEDGTGGGVGDNPFGTDVTPERTLDAQSFKTNIFQSNAQCPADKTLSMTLFTGRTFSRTLSFSMWCDKLAIFGSLILIAAYLYGASIIVRNS